MAVFAAGPKAVMMDFATDDIGYGLRGNGHTIRNAGESDPGFPEIFRFSMSAMFRSRTGLPIRRRRWLPPIATAISPASGSGRRQAGRDAGVTPVAGGSASGSSA